MQQEKDGKQDKPNSDFPYTAISFLVGSLTSILAGWIGMSIATYTNARTTYQCCQGYAIDAAIPDQRLDESYLDMMVQFHNIKKPESQTAADRKDTGDTIIEKVRDLK